MTYQDKRRRLEQIKKRRGAVSMLTEGDGDWLIAEYEKALTALNYISCPTMGFDSSMHPAAFATDKAGEAQARLALALCINNACVALDIETGWGVPSDER